MNINPNYSASALMPPPPALPPHYNAIFSAIPKFKQGVNLDELSREFGVDLRRYFEPMGDYTGHGRDFYNALGRHQQAELDNAVANRRDNLNNPASSIRRQQEAMAHQRREGLARQRQLELARQRNEELEEFERNTRHRSR